MKKSVRNNYIKAAFLLLVVIVGAYTGPQLLFMLQDRYTQDKVYTGQRDGMDISALNVDYPRLLQTRMKNYAQGLAQGRQYYAYATEYEVDDESYLLLSSLMEQEWASFLAGMDLIPEPYNSFFEKGYDIMKRKRYLICDKEFNNGVAFMAWYYEVWLSDTMQIRLLFDAEDNTLYAISFADIDENYFQKNSYEYFMEVVPMYWIAYYVGEGQSKEVYEQYMEDFGIVINEASDAAGVDGMLSYKEKQYAEEAYKAFQEAKYIDLVNTGHYDISLDYGENSLHWEVYLVCDSLSDTTDLCMGIDEIIRLIPEFAFEK